MAFDYDKEQKTARQRKEARIKASLRYEIDRRERERARNVGETDKPALYDPDPYTRPTWDHDTVYRKRRRKRGWILWLFSVLT